MFINIKKRNNTPELKLILLIKISDSTRVLRYIYQRLYQKGYINNKITILIYVNKKLVINNKFLRKKNKGL